GADRILELRDCGVSVCVDSAVRRHSWITFGPQLTLDDSLGYPPRPEQQATRLKYNLAVRSCAICHDSNHLTGVNPLVS
ncbi:hypothetical protein ACFU7Y_23265, partial [Kitasatospora sp. NPDC057542]|uniref:hypothetical protein n=1 Tax=Kitasatospora sp. NPDC057542 TaxID=3346162 RepID=UPI0036744D0A